MQFEEQEHSVEAGFVFLFAIGNGLLRGAFHWVINNIWV
ncbi:hypothetical protein P872_12865 [Rhodonellum psychrophilum GCM71 = DSM 17998]|uniref:Uncharacterized protein n=1 Tax=Rhodonellum psychrophilum GCM71 = DSM 17998 TaxID=1123057 RepID=U5BX94_9BACT|nr:hypothetical protein P872_12865 [Rhodonellum psychrophilum GCM71 = DSM 17998]